ncbi:MAG: type IV secretion system DNA-binding domain-containing protein [Gammaproteobacteria bacterium]|nr:type IV secretion system DNA-binding domain-containing protein [Gammaproteobacteria bacterium]
MEMSFMEIAMWGMVAVVPPLWYYKGGKNHEREGIDYHPLCDSSYPNPAYQLSGNRWTENQTLKNQFRESETNDLKFDNFEYGTSFHLKTVSIWKKLFMRKAEIFINPLKLTESVTMIAPMGGGKTVTMEALLAQPWYNRVLINDEKSGDFVSKWYNKRTSIILCPFDERAHAWDILSEDIEIVEFFIQNTINAVTGGNQSFFTNDAKERYIQVARLTIDIKEPKEKWAFFIAELESMFKEVEAGESKSAKDVISTMKQVIEMLKLVKFQIETGKQSFTISEFFKRKHQAKLFMVTVDKYNLQLNVLFSAFTACFAMIHASQKETKEDLTFYLLDEYLSLKMTYEAKLLLFTKIRSKGGSLLVAMHYLPDEQKMFDLLTSSTYAYLIFSVKNTKTREFFDKQVGKRDYMIRKTVNGQYQEHKDSDNILDWSEVDKIANEYKHITYMPQEGALFVGKSDYINKKEVHKPFILDSTIVDFKRLQNKEYLDKKEGKQKLKKSTEKYAQDNQEEKKSS